MRQKLCSCSSRSDFNRRGALRLLAHAGVGAAVLRSAPVQADAILSRPHPADEGFMRLALAQAKQGDFPFGAVIVREGKIAATGRNSGVRRNDPTAHGEMVAIRNFVSRRPASELKGATIYTTGEPCPMCMSAIIWSGFGRMVYAASIEQLSTRIGQIMVTSESVARAAPFEKIEITGGVLAAEALALFK